MTIRIHWKGGIRMKRLFLVSCGLIGLLLAPDFAQAQMPINPIPKITLDPPM